MAYRKIARLAGGPSLNYLTFVLFRVEKGFFVFRTPIKKVFENFSKAHVIMLLWFLSMIKARRFEKVYNVTLHRTWTGILSIPN
jgi:hypothetical protein